MPNVESFSFSYKNKRFAQHFSRIQDKPNYKERKTKEQDFIPYLISRQFSNFFNSYAQAYNKENNRKGSLFNNRFKREHIDSEEYLKKVIIYVHNNPVQAELAAKSCNWKFSSYSSIISKQHTIIKRNEVIELFDDLNNFVYCHR